MLTALVTRKQRPSRGTQVFSASLITLVLAQLGAGLVNLLLHAPIGLQLVHLLLSDLMWLALTLLAFNALSQPAIEAAVELAEVATPAPLQN
jgi:heme A synthase